MNEHVRFQDFTSEPEARALAGYGLPAEILFPVSFLEAIRLIRGIADMFIAEEAKVYEQGKAEHMFVFHMVLSEEIIDDADLVLSAEVDPDTFFWTVDSEGLRQLREKRPGLAKMLLQQLKKETQAIGSGVSD